MLQLIASRSSISEGVHYTKVGKSSLKSDAFLRLQFADCKISLVVLIKSNSYKKISKMLSNLPNIFL